MAGERRTGNTRGDRKGSFGDRKGPRLDSDRKSSFGDKKGTRFDSENRGSYSDKKGPKSDRFESDRKGPRNVKKSAEFTPEKRVPREPKLDVEVQEEQLGDNDKLEGRNSVLEALKANRTINKLFVIKGEREGSIRQIVAIARQKGIIVTEVEKNVLDSMSTSRSHQGVIAFVAVKEYVEVDDILEIAQKKGHPPFIIILDEITDPHNFGAILRTANAVGAHGVIIPKRRAIGLTSAVSKASAGAVEYVPVARVTNIAQTMEYLKKNNVWVVGTDATGEKAFFDSDLKGPMALVVGSEGEGMGKLIREKCDFVVNIPMQGEISSLNASVAAAIVMYEILKQRGKS
ncbi:MAG: rRNA methylase, putative, group 3 [Eubacterium sp.]|jgi:23S rRNA (guanosine2251-2'-O)-methyltransferase|nr:rRNA methylase, putative, group 3 [Eubacterium sp.]